MNRPTPSRRPLAGSRGGFTMIELLMVIVIIAILVGLLLPAINGALKSARRSAVSAEISQLAQALANFKSKYGDYPPSRFLAIENGNYSQAIGSTTPLTANTLDPTSPGTGDITLGQLAQRSVAAIRKFWPRVNTSTGITANTLVYDFNGNNQYDAPYVLHGHQCLVFFLGGVPSLDSEGNFGMLGFDKNPTNPFTNGIPPTPTVPSLLYSTNRQPPLFEFNAGRLFADPSSPIGIPGYYDSIGTGPPTPVSTTLNFYAYFSAYGNSGYDPNDVNFLEEVDLNTQMPIGLYYSTAYPVSGGGFDGSFAPNPYTSTVTVALSANNPGHTPQPPHLPPPPAVSYQTGQSFQIISSGLDGLYGVGGQFINNTTTPSTVPLPLDTVTNITSGVYINTSDLNIATEKTTI